VKKLILALLIAASLLSLCGCGNLFDKEYLVIQDAPAAENAQSGSAAEASVKSVNELKTAILNLVYSGSTEGVVAFSSEYNGSIAEDLASACWQIRSGNAICAYCVENIAYEMSRVVSHDEAAIHISYSDYAVPVTEIVRKTYYSGMDELLVAAMSEGKHRLAVSIMSCNYSRDTMKNLAEKVYLENAACVPTKPSLLVNVYTGNGMQKVYEFQIEYGLSEEEFRARMERLEAFALPEGTLANEEDAAVTALQLCEYLMQNRMLSDGKTGNSVYEVLFGKSGSPEGLALTYSWLCNSYGVECQTVSGQKDGEEHLWNIITLEGASYHVDVSACVAGETAAAGFLKRDIDIWENYRWNTAEYPVCEGTLTYATVLQALAEAVTEETATQQSTEGAA